MDCCYFAYTLTTYQTAIKTVFARCMLMVQSSTHRQNPATGCRVNESAGGQCVSQWLQDNLITHNSIQTNWRGVAGY